MRKVKKGLFIGGITVLSIVLLWLFLQFALPHFRAPFRPQYQQLDLTSLLERPQLCQEDYQTLFAQTGLAPIAIDELLSMGDTGVEQILATQHAFFTPPGKDVCGDLGITTREHRFQDESGALCYGAPLAPLRKGDIIVSLSTHTAGWTHGHAGLVVSVQPGITLESVVLGSLSDLMDLQHWRSYTTMLVLRPKADAATGEAVAQFALEHLYQIPYSLLSGVFGDKFQPIDSPHNAQCGYLPWYAWAAYGIDLDGDGGRIAAPEDLAMSPNVDIIQVYGVDPAAVPITFPG